MLLRSSLAAITAVGLSMGAASAASFTVDPSNYGPCIGAASCTVGAVTLAADPTGATLAEQSFRGVDGLGVSFNPGSGNEPELQGGVGGASSEEIIVSATKAFFLDEIKLAHFYNPDEFGSDPQETAIMTATFKDGTTASLELTSLDNTAGGFSVNDASLATIVRTSTSTGEFTLTDLFAGLGPLTQLVFSAAGTASGDSHDFSVASITGNEVPVPGAALMLLTGLGALGAARRSRKA